VEGAFDRARAILVKNRALLDESARALLEKETLADQELATVLGKVLPDESRIVAATGL
jgi:ATP-dependent Zn protease